MTPKTASISDIENRCRAVVAAAEDLKAFDLKVLQLGEVTSFTDFFLLLSGTSQRQVQAIADAVKRKLRDEGVRPLHVEGYTVANWVLMDYGDFVVHVFDEQTRSFYGLERLWSDAPDVSGQFASPSAARA